MKKLSLVMITKNEESNLKRCLESVKNIVNEIIVVDTGSTDNTKEVALSFNAKVYDYKWDDNFSNARNYAISKSTGDWNLILDADEYISKIDLKAILRFMNTNQNSIGQVKIINYFKENKEIRKSISYTSRLAPKNVYFTGSIHEQLNSSYPRKKVEIEVKHDGYLYINKFDRNIKLILKELEDYPNDSYLLYQSAKTYYTNNMFKDASPYFYKFYNQCDFKKDAFFEDGIVLFLYNLIKTNDLEYGLKVIDDNLDLLNNCCDFYFACGVFFTELVATNPDKYINYFDNIELCYLNAMQLAQKGALESVEGVGSFLSAYNLGIFYELTGDMDKAFKYYSISAKYNYQPACARLNSLKLLNKKV